MRLWILLPLLLAACGGSQEGARSAATGGGSSSSKPKGRIVLVSSRPHSDSPGAEADDLGEGAVVGLALLTGDVPPPRLLKEVTQTAGCLAEGHAIPVDERRLVDEQGHLANVVVRLLRTPEPPPPPTEPAILDQLGCVFVPHVLVLRAGQPLRIENSDGIVHNARFQTLRNPSANLNLGPHGKPVTLNFAAEEICKVSCDIHPWMSAFVVVVEHPWFAVTDRGGHFEIPGIPPGTYALEAWHELYGRLRLGRLVVSPGGETEVRVEFHP